MIFIKLIISSPLDAVPITLLRLILIVPNGIIVVTQIVIMFVSMNDSEPESEQRTSVSKVVKRIWEFLIELSNQTVFYADLR